MRQHHAFEIFDKLCIAFFDIRQVGQFQEFFAGQGGIDCGARVF